MFRRFTALFAAASVLSACAATDTFSPRASTYNTEADDLGNELLEVNILRAAQRLPLQFTDITTITGQTTAGGSIGYSTPFIGSPNASSRVLNPSVNGMLQTTFAAVALNTQEFYQGVSSPISAVQASYFVRSITPQELSFNLLFSQVNIYRGDDECKRKGYFSDCVLSFANNPRNIQSSNLFRQTVNYLLRLGLTMEDVKVFNKEFEQDKNGKRLVKFKDADKRDVARFCFRPADDEALKSIVDKTFLCGSTNAQTMLSKLPDENDQQPTISLNPSLISSYAVVIETSKKLQPEDDDPEHPELRRSDYDDRSDAINSKVRKFSGKSVRIEFVSRSTLDIFDYLGAIVSASNRDSRPLGQIRGARDRNIGLPCDISPERDCDPLFAMSSMPNARASSLVYNGQRLYLSSIDGRTGYSNITLSILKRILGLNTSSKSVPTPAIITGNIIQ